MTEEEWLAAGWAEALLSVGAAYTYRKGLLWAVACCRDAGLEDAEPEVVAAIHLHERHADDPVSDETLADRVGDVSVCAYRGMYADPFVNMVSDFFQYPTVLSSPGRFVEHCDFPMDRLSVEYDVDAAAIVREVFGNPFRPVAFDPRWRTSTAVGIAEQMYDAREFGAMPILADALQDTGCEDEAILSHCRDEGQVHVRGCWVCDLVLQKA